MAKSLAPIHIHLSGQDVGSVASLQNTRGREGGRGGEGREGRERGGGREEWNRHRESTCKCESYELCVFVCVRESHPPSSFTPLLHPASLPSISLSLPPREGGERKREGRRERRGREERGRNGWTEAGRERL